MATLTLRLLMDNEALYHALRLCFNAGADGINWGYVLHAIREGIDSPHITHILQEKDYKKHPELREIVEKLKLFRVSVVELERQRWSGMELLETIEKMAERNKLLTDKLKAVQGEV
jgi:hypothetical protein